MPTTETSTPTISTSSATAAPRDLRWTVWPLRDRFASLWWAPLLVTVLGVLVGIRVGSGLVGFGAAVALALSLAPQWVPVTYVVRRDNLEIRRLGRRRVIGWSHVRAVRSRTGGATLFAQSISSSGRREWSSVRVTFPADHSVGSEFRRRIQAARRTSAA